MQLVHRERGVGAVTDGATLADHRRIRQRMRGCGRGYMAANARRRVRLYRIDEPLGIEHVVHATRGGLRFVEVAFVAIPCIARVPLRAQGWEPDFSEIVDTAITTDHGVGVAC